MPVLALVSGAGVACLLLLTGPTAGTVGCLTVLPDGRIVSGAWDGLLLMWHGGKVLRDGVHLLRGATTS